MIVYLHVTGRALGHITSTRALENCMTCLAAFFSDCLVQTQNILLLTGSASYYILECALHSVSAAMKSIIAFAMA